MKHPLSVVMIAAVAVATAFPTSSEATRYVAHGTLVSGPASVRVWVEGGDVFPDYNDVTLWVRPERDCYTSLFLVDTAGYIHVLNTGRVHDDGWLYGGQTYGYHAGDLGLDRLHGRGIAYVFAVGSPVPFDYSYYGAGVRVGGFGYRVIGDPFVGCREFYTSLLPATCRWDYVHVNFTRFYVREWVRYPSYLCAGHVRVGDWCRHCEPVYTTYRYNVAAPYAAMRPVRYKEGGRFAADVRHVVRAAQPRDQRRYEPIMAPASPKTPVVVKDTRRIKAQENVRVVSTSRNYARSARVEKSGPTPAMAMNEKTGRSEPALVASKGRSQKHTILAPNAREKGAGKKTRQAE